MTNEHRYNVFISYSRADEPFALSLERALRRYRVPWWSGIQPARLEVFRDTSEARSTRLSEGIETALAESETLLVLCSPSARDRPWVNREIELFARAKGNERIVPVLVEGLPHNEAVQRDRPDLDAFPATLRAVGLSEPWAPDFRRAAERKQSPPADQAAWFHLLSVIYDVPRKQIEQRERRRLLQAALAGFVAVSVVAGGGWQLWAERSLSSSIRLAQQVQEGLARRTIDKALLLKAIDAAAASDTPEARSALRSTLAALKNDAHVEEFNLAVSPDDKRVAISGPFFDSLVLLSPQSPDLKFLCGNFGSLYRLWFSPDSRYLFGIDRYHTLHAWEMPGGGLRAAAPVEVEDTQGRAVGVGVEWSFFAPSKTAMVTGFRSYPPVLWQIPSLSRTSVTVRKGGFLVHPTLDIGVSFPIVDDEPKVTTWSLRTGETVSELSLPADRSYNFNWVRITKDGRQLIGAIDSEFPKDGFTPVLRTIDIDARGGLSLRPDRRLADVELAAVLGTPGPTFWDYRMRDAIAMVLRARGLADGKGQDAMEVTLSPSESIGYFTTGDKRMPVLFDPQRSTASGPLSDWPGGPSHAVFEAAGTRLYAFHESDAGVALDGWDTSRRIRVWGPKTVYDLPRTSVADSVSSGPSAAPEPLSATLAPVVKLSRDGRRLFVVLPCKDRGMFLQSAREEALRAMCGVVVVYDTATGETLARLSHAEHVNPDASRDVLPLGSVGASPALIHISESGDLLVTSRGQQAFVWDVPKGTSRQVWPRDPTASQTVLSARMAWTDQTATSELLRIARARLHACPD